MEVAGDGVVGKGGDGIVVGLDVGEEDMVLGSVVSISNDDLPLFSGLRFVSTDPVAAASVETVVVGFPICGKRVGRSGDDANGGGVVVVSVSVSLFLSCSSSSSFGKEERGNGGGCFRTNDRCGTNGIRGVVGMNPDTNAITPLGT